MNQIELGTKEDVLIIYQFIKDRIEWMNENNIKAWNQTDYLYAFPLEFFIEEAKLNRLYVIRVDNKVVGGVVILEEDDNWNDHIPSLYIHNLVTKIGVKGIGKQIIQQIFTKAKSLNKEYVRLDCDRNNKVLLQYYQSLGFKIVGECEEGKYKGYCLEKKIV